MKVKAVRPRVFFMQFMSYMLILVLAILLCSMIYSQVIREFEEQEKERSQSILVDNLNSVVRNFAQVDTWISQLTQLDGLQSVQYMPPVSEGGSLYRVYDTWRDVSNSMLFVQPGMEYMLYFSGNDVVMTQRNAMLSQNVYYGSWFNVEGYDLGAWRELLNAQHHQTVLPVGDVVLEGAHAQRVTYLSTLHLDAGQAVPVNAAVFFDEDMLLDMSTTGFDLSDSYACLSFGGGNVIIGDGHLVELAQKDGCTDVMLDEKLYTLFSGTDSTRGVRSIIAVPRDRVILRISHIRNVLIGIVAVMLALGLLITFILSYINSRTAKRMANMFDDLGEGACRNEYAIIQNGITRMMEDKKGLEKRLTDHIPILLASLVGRMLRGEFSDEAEIASLMEQVNCRLPGRKYAVMLFRLVGYQDAIDTNILDEMERNRVLLNEALQAQFMSKAIYYNLNMDELVLIIGLQDSDIEDDVAVKLAGRALEEYDVHASQPVRCGLGESVGSLTEVYESFNQAECAVSSASAEHERIVRYSSCHFNALNYAFFNKVQNHLQSQLHLRDVEGVQRTIEKIRVELFCRGGISSGVQQQLLYELRGILYRVLDDTEDREDDAVRSLLARISSTQVESSTSYLNGYYAWCIELIGILSREHKSHNEKMISQIISHLQENYADSGLGLKSVSAAFNISEVYLSRFFKEQSGENFNTFVENLRMKQAYSIIRNRPEGLTIKDLAASVGYNSADTFRKAFKRVYGVNPSSYL